jgi:hypothetical protein
MMGMLSVYLIRQPADDWVEKRIKLGEHKAAKSTATAALVNQHSSNGLPTSEEPTPKSSPTKQVRMFVINKIQNQS